MITFRHTIGTFFSEGLISQLRDAFSRLYDRVPSALAWAPGRVNLIGEHTDYNDGFVLPAAINRAVRILLRSNGSDVVRLRSMDFPGAVEFNLGQFERGSGWSEYVKGVAWSMMSAGMPLAGWDGLVSGNVPVGAGLSSSAALEVAAARAFTYVAGLDWDGPRMAKLAQKGENEWVGVRCGIMDLLISATALPGHAALIDCRSLEIQQVPLPAGATIVILDTTTRRGLSESEYNLRRVQCEAAARFFGVEALRDLHLTGVGNPPAELDPVVWRRARHVVTENDRTLAAATALGKGDLFQAGRLMASSHESLREDFQVSSTALDAIVDCARQEPVCFGARMTGAGFGGCAVALVPEQAAEDFTRHVTRCYRKSVGLEAAVFVTPAAGGAGLIPL